MKIVNKTGYLKGTKTAKNPVNIIPSNLITTQGMAFPIKANGKTLYPNTGQYKFNTPYVVETPLKQDGANKIEAGPVLKKAIKENSKPKSFTWKPPTNVTLGKQWHKQMKAPKKQEGTQAAKANLFSKPTIGVQAKNITKYVNTPAFKKQVEDKKKEERLKFENAKKFPQKASGKANMTIGPIDAAVAGVAGIPGLVGRGLTTALPYVQGALNAPLTTAVPGVTTGNILASGFAADAMVNRLPKVPGQIKRKEYGAAAENTITGALDLLGAGMIKTSPVKFGNKSKIKYSVNPNTNVSNKVEANAVIKPKINFEELKKSIKKDFSPDDFTNAVTERFTYRNPYTNEVVYQLDPEDYNNFTNPDDIKLAKGHFDEYVNKYKADIAKGQEEVVEKVKRLLISKQPLLKSEDFYTKSEVKKIIKNDKDFKNLEKEINEINPNFESEEDLSKIFLTRPDLEKRWYSMMEHGKTFDKKFLTPSQQKYLDKQRGYVSGTSKPLFMPSGSKVNETLHPSPQELRKVKFPIQFGPGSINKEGNKSVNSNLIKYKDGSKGVSLSFSRGEKDPKGGLTQKGVDKYNRATGGNLKMAVTTPPSKLKAGSKAANRRKSFCARMSGVKGPMAKNGKPTRKALALRKWNC